MEYILAIVDEKTELDMREVLTRFDSFDSKLSSIKDSMQFEISGIKESMQFEISGIKESMQNIEKRLESKMDVQFKMVLWSIGVAFIVISTLITIFKFLG